MSIFLSIMATIGIIFVSAIFILIVAFIILVVKKGGGIKPL